MTFEHFSDGPKDKRLAVAGRGVLTSFVLLTFWAAGVAIFKPAPFILPGPVQVLVTIVEQAPSLLHHAGITLFEIVLGLIIGAVLGVATALLMNAVPIARRYVMPVVVASQALPVFAIAPLLVLWFVLVWAPKLRWLPS